MRSRRYLLLLVFIAGACSLGLELVTSSLLAPYFGTSRLVWANIIGVTLIALSVGYVWGGRLADRRPELTLLCTIMAGAGALVTCIPALSRPVLLWSLQRLAPRSDIVLLGSLFGVLALFSVPTMLLGMVSPFAIRLDVRDLKTAGSTAGTLYAYSTVGSILGTFLPTLLLTPLIGTRRTIYLFASLLLLAPVPGLWTTRRGVALGALAGLLLTGGLLAAPAGSIRPSALIGGQVLYEGESPYNYIQVVSYSAGRNDEVCLTLNQGGAVHSIYHPAFARSRDPRDLITGGYWDLFTVAPYLYPHRKKADVRSLALVGAAAGTVPKQFLAIYGPQFHVDGVEIDPRIVDAGRAFFAMEDRDPHYLNYRTHVEDGRIFMTLTRQHYDVIGIDAYRPLYIPAHLATREFFQTVRSRLNPEGVAVLNVIGGMSGPVGGALAGTMKGVFPQVFLMDASRGNLLIVGVNQPVGDGAANFRDNFQRMKDPVLRRVMAGVLESRGARPALREWSGRAGGFTDDWAPIDWIMDRHSILDRFRSLKGS